MDISNFLKKRGGGGRRDKLQVQCAKQGLSTKKGFSSVVTHMELKPPVLRFGN